MGRQAAASIIRQMSTPGTQRWWAIYSRNQTPEGWLAGLHCLPGRIRPQVASIIVWDHYGNRPVPTAIRQIMDSWRPADVGRSEIAPALVSLGYSKSKAWTRTNALKQ